MKRYFVFSIASMIMIFAGISNAAIGWEENFDPIKTTWVQTSATWTDLAGTTAKLTESDPVNSYGVAASETITVDVSTYKDLVVSTTQVDSGAYYSIQIQEVGGAGAYANAVSYAGAPGTHKIDIAALMGWSGTKSFVVNVWIEGDSKGVTFSSIRMQTRPLPAGWEEDFEPIKATWVQTSATWTDVPGPTATLTESDPVNGYGVAASETITVDLSTYKDLVVTTTQVDSGAYYSIQIQEVGGAGAYADAVSYAGAPGTHTIDIAALMGWSGTKSFVINVWIDGNNKGVTFSTIRMQSLATTAGWLDHFDPIKITWAQTTATWTDLAGTTAKLTESDPNHAYGFAQTEVITVDLRQYNELVVSSTAMDSGAIYTVQIQEIGGANASANAVSYVGVPSTQVVDIAKLMGWTGIKSFVINIWIDGDNKGVTFDRIEVRQTQQLQSAWEDIFDPVRTTWGQESCIWTDTAGPGAVLIENNPSAWYGVVHSEVITVDVNAYNELYIKTSAVESGCYYSIQIVEVGGAGAYKDAFSYLGVAGTYTSDLRTLMGWSGTKTFRIDIWLDGEAKSVTFDNIKLRNGAKLEPFMAWRDHFDPIKETWFEPSAYWTDNGDSTATVTEDQAGASYGKVESETIDANVSKYSEVTVVVTDITGGWLDIAIQERNTGSASGDLITGITEPGVYKGSIPVTMGWTGQRTFGVVLWMNGNGQSATIESVTVAMNCGTDVLLGDYDEDCKVDFYDLVVVGDSWMTTYDGTDLADIAGNWLEQLY